MIIAPCVYFLEIWFNDYFSIMLISDKHEDGGIPIMPRGNHRYHFQFKLPESALPSSFESKIGTIRYYIRMTMDIPYSSSPQGIKYFTIVGPHIDCMDDKYLVIRIYIINICVNNYNTFLLYILFCWVFFTIGMSIHNWPIATIQPLLYKTSNFVHFTYGTIIAKREKNISF